MEELRISPKLNNAIKRCFLSCAALLIGVASVLLVSGASSVSLAADVPATVNDLTFSFEGSTRTVKQGGGYIVDVPLYLTTSFNRTGYLSGLVYFPKPSISFKDSTGANLLISSFIPFSDQGITFTWAQGSHVFMYFDNVNFTGNGNKVFLGSFRFEFTNANDITNVVPNPSSFTVTPAAEGLTASTAPLGFEAAFINAINSANDIDSIITILNSINGLSADLSAKLATNNQYIISIDTMLSQRLPSILTTLSSINTNETFIRSYLLKILYGLAGVNPDVNSDAQIEAAVYDRWINLIAQAMNKNNPADTGGNKADQIANGLDNLTQDMAVNKPQNIENVADSYLQSVDTELAYSSFSWLNNSVIVTMLCIVISVAGLSYLLYGKK